MVPFPPSFFSFFFAHGEIGKPSPSLIVQSDKVVHRACDYIPQLTMDRIGGSPRFPHPTAALFGL